MKKFIVVACLAALVLLFGYYARYFLGAYIDWNPNAPVTTFMTTDEDTIYMERDGETVPFEIRGVNLGVGIPGEWATDYAVDEETYLRWFRSIQELGANTIRVYITLHDDFYNAFYTYNTRREAEGLEHLWLLHGVWVNDYIQFSHRDAYDEDFLGAFLEDCRSLVDVLHGERDLSLGRGTGSGSYRKDVSPWVIGYILGVEWEDVTVAYTNEKYAGDPAYTSYTGTYLTTTQDATAFEAMLARVGDEIIRYETERYHQQRLIAFSNWPTTDPFCYSVVTTYFRTKFTSVNVEHIQPTDAFLSGYFASYHVYSYFPDYLQIDLEGREYTEEMLIEAYGGTQYERLKTVIADMNVPNINEYLTEQDYYDDSGRFNTYRAYLTALNRFHSIPVVISEYGVTTGRGMAQVDVNTNRNQGHMTEQEQGQALVDCCKDIRASGSAGSCVFTWQDEWFKRTWNTMHAVDLQNTPYWSDYQTNEQYFGLLAFDPGEETSVCYVDGDLSEWGQEDRVWENGTLRLSMKYDEKFLCFFAEGFDPDADVLFIPLDITPKTGSTYCQNYDLSFTRPCDFVISIDGEDNSRVVVQERYEVLRAMYGEQYYAENPFYEGNQPDPDTPVFKEIHLPLVLENIVPLGDKTQPVGETYETGKLRCGNANPEAPDFDSLADFCFTEDGVEIRIPWQLLNFSNPSEMMVHDDYYECYGVENLQIEELYVGAALSGQETRVSLSPFALEGWGKQVTYHERLKESYYILQDYWTALDGEEESYER